MAKNKTNLALTEASDKELANVLRDLVENGTIAVETVNAKLSSIQEELRIRANTASEVEKELSQEQLLSTLKERFDQEGKGGAGWNKIKSSLEANPKVLLSIHEMEKAGYMPVVYSADDKGFDIGVLDAKLEVKDEMPILFKIRKRLNL